MKILRKIVKALFQIGVYMVKKCANGLDTILQSLSSLANCMCAVTEEGEIVLNQGHHEITIYTSISPVTVSLSVTSCFDPVCIGDVDMVGYKILPDGFVLYADIASGAAAINYFVEG
jgi:hypothetical protein